jgi:hypothetical protein
MDVAVCNHAKLVCRDGLPHWFRGLHNRPGKIPNMASVLPDICWNNDYGAANRDDMNLKVCGSLDVLLRRARWHVWHHSHRDADAAGKYLYGRELLRSQGPGKALKRLRAIWLVENVTNDTPPVNSTLTNDRGDYYHTHHPPHDVYHHNREHTWW